MKFTPDYGVVYRDGFHPAGRPFEIRDEDAEEMSAHGTVERPEQSSIFDDAPAPKPRARRKKNES